MTEVLEGLHPDGYVLPEFHQENTQGIGTVKLPEVLLNSPPEINNDYAASPEQRTELLKTAQQVVFLPHFRTTDHIFYGEIEGPETAREGYPTVRSGLIDGANFHLLIQNNFNYGYTYFSLNMHSQAHLFVHFDRDDLGLDRNTANWLIGEVFSPIRDELMSLPLRNDEF